MAQMKGVAFMMILAVLAVAVSAQDTDFGAAPAMAPSAQPPAMESAAFSLPVSAAFIVSSLLLSFAGVFKH